MPRVYPLLAKPLLAVQGSEQAHARALRGLRLMDANGIGRWLLRRSRPRFANPVNVFGLTFRNPLGLAAGMDKQGAALRAWDTLGFGFIEVGGITEHAQHGNPRPRMFRDGEQHALINRMGFNNVGSQAMEAHLSARVGTPRWPTVPVFLNVGKSKTTPNERAAEDYEATIRRCGPYVDAIVVNVSSPNTAGLRDLQEVTALERILHRALEAKQPGQPLLIKVAPDIDEDALIDLVRLARDLGVAGMVATNTTLKRSPGSSARSMRIQSESGGLSGKPLARRSTEVIRCVARFTGGGWPIIGVGGISTAEDAWEKIINGASIVQLYSGLVFRGPGIIREVVEGIHERCEAAGFPSLLDAVGSALQLDTD